MPASSRPKSLRHQRSALIGWGKTVDWAARTEKARKALGQKFLDQADGDPKRAQALRKAFYLELAQKGAESRRRSREAKEAARQARIAALIPEAEMGDGDAA